MTLWTKEHAITLIPTFVAMVVVALIMRHFLKNKEEKFRMIPIQVIAVTLVVLEIGKQIYSILHGYDLYHIPLHFCSLFIYMLPLFAFYKGKFVQHIRAFTTMCCAMLFVFLAVYPDLIYGAGDITNFFNGYLNFHTVVFHNLALFASILILALNLFTPETKRDTKTLFIGFGIYSAIAGTMAQLLKTNFNNFYECNIPPLRSVQVAVVDKLGWFGQLIYVLVTALLIYIFALVCYWLYRGFLALVKIIKKAIANRKQNKAEQN